MTSSKNIVEYGEKLRPFIGQTEIAVRKAAEEDALVIMEGAQGALLDPDFGTYPFVTSSAPHSCRLCPRRWTEPKNGRLCDWRL